MSFFELTNVSTAPDRYCEELLGSLLKAFPANPLETHDRNGYTFQGKPCLIAEPYSPDYCAPPVIKMDPESFGPIKSATLGMLQSALTCTFGVTMDELRDEATIALRNQLWRAIDQDLVTALALEAVDQTPAPIQAVCVLAEAGQFLASSGICGNGVIVGPISWFLQLGKEHLVWNGQYHTDLIGNIVIPLSVDGSTVYAFDSTVEVRISEVQLLDETMPGQRNVNDRTVRAEQIYTVAFDACVVGSFDVSACCDCPSGGGGGGGGGNVTVTNFPANQNVTVSNFPADSDFDFEELLLCDDNGPFIHRSLYNAETGVFISATNTDLAGAAYVPVGTVAACGSDTPTPITASRHFDALPGTPWTPALVVATLTSVTYTVLAGTATVTDSTGVVIAGLPVGLSSTWENDLENALTGAPLSIAADPGSRLYVTWTEV